MKYKLIITIFCFPILLIADAAPEWGIFDVRKPTTKASSILKEPKKTYPASNATDGKLSTAWCEGVKGSGIGETLEVEFSPTPGSGVSVFAGFGGNKKLYYANNRIKGYEMTITMKNGRTKKFKGKFSDGLCGYGDHRECSDVSDDEESKEYKACVNRMEASCHLNDYNQGGIKYFDKPQCLTKIKIKILSVHKGKKHDDTCISEISLIYPIDTDPEEREAFEAIEKTCK